MLTLALALLLFVFLPWQVALPLYVAITIGWLAITRKALEGRRDPPLSGPEAMVGDRALVANVRDQRTDARYKGESWQAVSSQPLRSGEQVLIVAVEGLTLRVVPDDESARAAGEDETVDEEDLTGSERLSPSSGLCKLGSDGALQEAHRDGIVPGVEDEHPAG